MNGVTEYAQLLSPCKHKGKLNLKEKEESAVTLSLKLRKLATLLLESGHTVVHTGAGISTKAGIADFRGPCGLWTLEGRNQSETCSISFEDALPTVAHLGISQLCKEKLVQFVVTQNVDGIHRKSGVPEELLAEVHGCLFVGYCKNCNRKQVLDKPTKSVGFKDIHVPCSSCNGSLCDFVLDWYDELPKLDLENAITHSKKADLHIVIGSSLQMLPCKNFCLMSSAKGANVVIINLSETSQDSKATMLVRGDSDRCISAILFLLQLPVVLWVPKEVVQVSNSMDARKFKDRNYSADNNMYWQLVVDCSAFPRSPHRIQPDRVETHPPDCSVDWTWDERCLLEIWLSSPCIPTVSVTFQVFFPQMPCCSFSVKHSFSYMNNCVCESFRLSNVSSLTDVVEGFYLAHSQCIDPKEMRQLLCSNPESFFYKSTTHKRYQICLLCEREVYCTSRKRHLMRKHYYKKH